MLYSINYYQNIYAIETPIIAVVSNVSTSCQFPFSRDSTSANVAIYVDSLEFRETVGNGVEGEMFSIQPIENKYIDINTNVVNGFTAGSDDYNKSIIATALGVDKTKITNLVIE